MGLQIDWFAQIVEVTSPTTSVDLQTLHDFVEDQMATPVGSQHSDILQPEGKIEDASNPGVFSQIICVLHSPWQIQFWPGSGYTTIFGGKLVGGLIDQPIKATGAAGDITVLNSPVDGVATVVETGISGLTPDEAATLALLDGIEGTLDHAEIMRILLAAAAGKVSGAAGTNVKIRDQADTKDRIDATVDATGNRTAVTLDAS